MTSLKLLKKFWWHWDDTSDDDTHMIMLCSLLVITSIIPHLDKVQNWSYQKQPLLFSGDMLEVTKNWIFKNIKTSIYA